MLETLIIFHILFSVLLIILILLQKGKGATMGAAFGAGASQTVFGSRGSFSFLMKLTMFIAALFFATSITLTYFAAKQAKQNKAGSDYLSKVEQVSKEAKAKQEENANKFALPKSDTSTNVAPQTNGTSTTSINTNKANVAKQTEKTAPKSAPQPNKK